MIAAEQTLPEALEAFDFGAPLVGAIRYGHGHINDTFCVHTQPDDQPCVRFILQRINTQVFRHPDQLMKNVLGVTEFLAREVEKNGGDRSREVMQVLRPRSGEDFFTDSQGGAWRLYPFVEGTHCLQSADTPELFAASGRAFGHFQKMLAKYPAETLFETVPHFHDTEDRLAKFKAALAEDKLGRAGTCEREIRFVLDRQADCSVCMQALRDGVLPLRVTHNDTKLNNVLMDAETGEGICIIDLDTTMPGLSVNDFGDSIRYGANHCAEDERDPSRVELDLELFDVYAGAFLEGCGGALTQAELDYMPWGAKLMTLECGMRFLTDYLEGDVYFTARREGQNLDRAQTQFKLVSDMEAHWDAMNAIINKYKM